MNHREPVLNQSIEILERSKHYQYHMHKLSSLKPSIDTSRPHQRLHLAVHEKSQQNLRDLTNGSFEYRISSRSNKIEVIESNKQRRKSQNIIIDRKEKKGDLIRKSTLTSHLPSIKE